MEYLFGIEELPKSGYLVERLTHYQYRIECVLDLYTGRFRWHNIATGNRGSWHGLKGQALRKFIDQQVTIADAILDREIAAGRVEDSDKRPWLTEENKPWFTKVQR